MRGLQRGPDLVTLNPERLNRVFQTFYIVTAGCDYVSYFKNIGKKPLQTCSLNTHHSLMIWICHAGCLSQTVTGNREDGFLAFLRLIGIAKRSRRSLKLCAYERKN